MPCQVGSARSGPFKANRIGLLFGSWEVPGSRAAWLVAPRDPLRIVGPLPPV
jgi:hypothetical protein